MRTFRKLRSRKGETLTETLVAVLLVGLASVVLASMISAASHMSAQALERDTALYDEITVAEAQSSGQNGSVTVEIGGSSQNFNVTYFGEEDQLHSYSYDKGGGGS